MAKVLALDLDGTLFFPKGRKRFVSKKNAEFIHSFIERGNKVVLVTSRPAYFVEMVNKELGLDLDYVCLCGAIIKLNGKIVKDKCLDNKDFSKFLDEIKERYHPIGYFLTCEDPHVIVCPQYNFGSFMRKFYLWVYKLILGIYREEIVIDPDLFYESLKSSRLYNLKAYFGLTLKAKKMNREIHKYIQEKYPSIESSWMSIVLEFSPKGCNKGDSLMEYVHAAGINKDDVYVVGDSGNDIAMFNKFYENSICMKHAYPSVKNCAKYRVSRVYKLDKYLFGRSKDE